MPLYIYMQTLKFVSYVCILYIQLRKTSAKISLFPTFRARSFLALWRLRMYCNCLRKNKIEHFSVLCVGFFSFLLLEPNQQVIFPGWVSSWRLVVTEYKVSVCICLCHCDQMCKLCECIEFSSLCGAKLRNS